MAEEPAGADIATPRAPALMRITVLVSLAPRQVSECTVQLHPGSTLADALQAAGQMAARREGMACGIWGRAMPETTLLKDGDRVELYRELKVDPKVARRERFARQGARSTGLFARQRPGGKSGY
ncbi:RnfH family protein [Acidovorax sp. sif1233]|uniref:RnfH family protein n=2 Tax=unclassified Acidovorax TaxID=2684926 RepID=UPI001C46BB3D|nr:RnfH family protein [Acidovorax sp. sif1233]MBV7454260.1 RnfH family protein [Acidovorax sp. sif1233]